MQGLGQADSNDHLEVANNATASMPSELALQGGAQAPPMDPAGAMQRATVSEESARLALLALLAAGEGFGSTTAGGAGANEWAWPRSAADPHSRAISPSPSHHLTAIQLALLSGPIAGSSGEEDQLALKEEEEEEEELLRQLSGQPCTAPLAPPSASSNMRDGQSIVGGVGGSFTSDTAAARATLRSPPQLNLPPFPGEDTTASAQQPPSPPPALTYTTSDASAQPPIPRIRRVESIESVGTVEGEPPSPSLSGLSPSASGLPSRQASTASLAATTSTWTAKVQPGVTKSW